MINQDAEAFMECFVLPFDFLGNFNKLPEGFNVDEGIVELSDRSCLSTEDSLAVTELLKKTLYSCSITVKLFVVGFEESVLLLLFGI